MARHDRKGRSVGLGRFAALPHDVFNSAGYRQTSPAARAVLIELALAYSGQNNGRIGLSVRKAAERCNISKTTAMRALQELEDAGLIECAEAGGFRNHRRQASAYRLLWQRCDVTGAVPARKYRLE